MNPVQVEAKQSLPGRARNRRFTAGFLVIVVIAIAVNQVIERHRRGPFQEVDFKEDHPGAGDRHVTFTPVLRADPSKVIGPTVGADYGKIKFRDCDDDGVSEAVIETDEFIESGEYKASVRHVYRFVRAPNGEARVELISSEDLPEKDPQWLGREEVRPAIKRFCAP